MTEGVFGLERYLHEFLVDNWERLDLGKEWALLEEDGDVVGSHYPTGEVGEIDLLAKHKSADRWLVIELKRDQSSDATVGQLLRYMGWVRRKLANGRGEVRGLIICSEPDTKMRYALDGQPHIQCMTYQVSFALGLVPSFE
jgi:RecB family endonuclease NucS